MEIIKDRNGKPEGVIRKLAGDREVLTSNSGNQKAYYDPNTNATYTPGGSKIGTGNRLVGMAGRK
jgi:hypothetical protein